MKKTDTLFIGVILGLLVLVAHYSVVGGSIFASLMVLINLLDSKERRTYGSKRSFEERKNDC
ncbi:hypothetical protein IGK31_001170 [Enterococcus sp. DIV1288f]|uniref:Uncharacterized protein n=1 Tax=Enterococcus mundtii TaxID=53346 RepID=A0A1I4K805_ENTMU|nr:hypothetical protein BTN92_15685 [Enterococcus mundtii]OTP28292.1 hypothetical protein A5802_002032 [Enterococcus mundtii]QCJ56112.1 hypothetical protein DDJ96_05605 [Enterococcus mundtii]RYT06954.1 hypothetical protein EAI87_00405 [Enterococcus mundtii]SFL74693.1 hypothetical protein SAMN04487758_102216 [Enterococcus mundtii]